MWTGTDFDELMRGAATLASMGMLRGSIALYMPKRVTRDTYADAAMRADAIDRVHFTKAGLPFHADRWDNRLKSDPEF